MLPKLLFHVTNEHLAAASWQRGQLTPGPRLRLDADGLAAFGHYLDAHPGIPAYLIADLVEEDFQRHLLPHVRGRSRRNLVERRLGQLYRDTPFRHAALQERDPEGRRDDHALFSALTNPALVQPWIAVMEQRQTALAAVYSGAHLAVLLARRLALAQEHLLLITEQAGALRQSYFQGPYLRFSRLTALTPLGDAASATAAAIANEAARMQQFLTSTRLISRGGMLQVVIVAPASRIAALEAACMDGTETSFHFIDMDSAAARCKLAETPSGAERLLLELVARDAPPSQYALPSPRRFYRIWQARAALNALAAAVALVGGLWLLADAWASVGAARQSSALLAAAARDDARYQAGMASLPAPAVKSADMKAAVLLNERLAAQAPAPGQMAALVSRALDTAPAVRLMNYDWRAGQDAAPDPGAVPELARMAGPSDQLAPIPASVTGLLGAPVQTLRIEGEIDAAQSDYRAIVDSVNQFAAALARNPGVAVEIAEAPIDVRQNVKLSGKTSVEDGAAKPKFVLKVSWKP